MTELSLTNNQKWRGRIYRYAPLILWMGLVLFASTGTASMARTSIIIRPLLEFLFPSAPSETLDIYHGYIRKSAHFFEYGVLGLWAARAYSASLKLWLRKYWYVFAFLTVLTVATIDETNQSFNPARTGTPRDVLLDCTGGATMILLFHLSKKFFDKRKNAAISIPSNA